MQLSNLQTNKIFVLNIIFILLDSLLLIVHLYYKNSIILVVSLILSISQYKCKSHSTHISRKISYFVLSRTQQTIIATNFCTYFALYRNRNIVRKLYFYIFQRLKNTTLSITCNYNRLSIEHK